MTKNSSVVLIAILLMMAGCNQKQSHFISDPDYRQRVEKDLSVKMEVIGNAGIFPDFSDKKYSLREREALKFFYAYMPLSDIADYSPEFYLDNIRQSFTAQEEMPWGKDIPEEVFRHFVLPIRVNNENLDSSRMVFYRELKERVRNLSMYDAILEVNHWCHEKVTYRPTDARTSSPLATVRTAYGRCGEESTFTVAALRAVGIPARQVYTPRWAHTDNNHAWVEAWADGKWYYLGACEPAPVLDMGWFDAPVKRALLLHTNVFGRYTGPEDIMQQTHAFAEINVTSNYVDTAKTTIRVVDSTGKSVADAHVEFGIYNYAEFYPVLSTQTDENGEASISTGLGDFSVWASKDGKMALEIVSAGKRHLYEIALQFKEGDEFVQEFDIVPPPEIKSENNVSQEAIDANNKRLASEDSIRNAYVATFISHDDAIAFAKQIDADTALTATFLTKSRGNWSEIQTFLADASKNNNVATALKLLEVIAEKDLRDTPASVLKDHLDNVTPENSDIFYRYVLNPRIDYELITPYRGWLQQHIPAEIKEKAATDPAALEEWVNRIKTADEFNPQYIPISPIGVMKLGMADSRSKNIFFVAVCRSLHIPARLEEITGKLQYYHNNRWHDVNFDAGEAKAAAPKGFLKLNHMPTQALKNPLYDTHFTIANITGNSMRRLNFRNTEGAESTVSLQSCFQQPVEIEEGYYMLITGTRMASGKVLVRITTFNIEEGKTTSVDLILRKDNRDIQVIGEMDPEALFLPENKSDKQSILATTGRGYFIVGILGAGQEPSNHFLRDLARLKTDFESWNRGIILLFPNEDQWKRFDKADSPELPSTLTFGIDEGGNITNQLVKNLNLASPNNLPIVIIADTFGRVVYASQGYKIGIGDELIQIIKRL